MTLIQQMFVLFYLQKKYLAGIRFIMIENNNKVLNCCHFLSYHNINLDFNFIAISSLFVLIKVSSDFSSFNIS